MAEYVYSDFTEVLGSITSTSNVTVYSDFTEVLGGITSTSNVKVYSEFIEVLYDPNVVIPSSFVSSVGLIRNELVTT